jgi:H+-translocating NAD(P) transhydrogenase subunit alpha
MTVGVLKEPSFESRVSLLAENTAVLVKKGIPVWVETGAGLRAFNGNEDYSRFGAMIKSREEILAKANVLLSMHYNDIPETLQNSVLIGIYQPLYNFALMRDWGKNGLTVFSLDMLPRTSRAQSMDVLSSQANIAGYKAVITAADLFPRYFPMLMTAAGSIPPAKVLVLGAGVAGLQAIATARRLGAVVEVFDTRPAVREEVMSLGGKFIEVEGAADATSAGGYAVEQTEEFRQRQKNRIGASIAKADIVNSTAQIPGKPAPILVTTMMIDAMKKGSVIVDLASATGGNTELTKDNETVLYHGVSILGNSALASLVPFDASKLYSKNLLNFLELITDKEGGLNLNFKDDLVEGCCITHQGAIVNEKVKFLSGSS